jgi:hypothetical protein
VEDQLLDAAVHGDHVVDVLDRDVAVLDPEVVAAT